jgi:hypothetical protein
MAPTLTKERLTTIEELLERPHFTVLRKGSVAINLIVPKEEVVMALPVTKVKAKPASLAKGTTAKKTKKKDTLIEVEGASNFNITEKNRCGFDVLKGFKYSVRVGGRGLNSNGFVIDAPKISDLVNKWQKRDSWWRGSCEDIAASLAQGVLALAQDHIELILVKIEPNPETEIELMWQRGQTLPANGVKQVPKPEVFPEEYYKGCGYYKLPY